MKTTKRTPSGVSEVQFRRALESLRHGGAEGAALSSSALQSDLARKYKLPGAKMPRQLVVGGPKKSGAAPKSDKTVPNCISSTTRSSSHHAEEIYVSLYCPVCDCENNATSSICVACGYFLYSARQPESTLAQRMGLVEAPAATEIVSLERWNEVEQKLSQRNEAFCPICMIGFNQGSEIVLSCSHIFHKACITSFEKFMENKGERCCPICRAVNYQKKLTSCGSDAFKIVCCIRIQTYFRGILVRRKYQAQLRSFYRSGGGLVSRRKRFYQQELESYANRVSDEIDKRSNEVNSMISDVDATLMESKQLDAMFEMMLSQRQRQNWTNSSFPSQVPNYPTTVDGTAPCIGEFWTDILRCARERGWHECAICMGPNTCSRQTVLLSCSHVFHAQCIDNFEKFAKGEIVCPVCRRSYDKQLLSEHDFQS